MSFRDLERVAREPFKPAASVADRLSSGGSKAKDAPAAATATPATDAKPKTDSKE